tara:strand:- start:771 stop:899 length:129 start_codon:yes stop_codon:yes gene_type:complete
MEGHTKNKTINAVDYRIKENESIFLIADDELIDRFVLLNYMK